MRPTSSPCAPAEGCSEQSSMPLTSAEHACCRRCHITSSVPCASSSGVCGCSLQETRAGARGPLVDLRVVFHGARPERVELRVDAEVPLRQPRKCRYASGSLTSGSSAARARATAPKSGARVDVGHVELRQRTLCVRRERSKMGGSRNLMPRGWDAHALMCSGAYLPRRPPLVVPRGLFRGAGGAAGPSGLPSSLFSLSQSPPPTRPLPAPPIDARSGFTLRCFTPPTDRRPRPS
jgi:hypothetical protein